MAASAVVAASAVAASGVAATATSGLNPALIGFAGTVLGAAIAQGVALFIAHRNRSADARKDAVTRAFNTAGSHMATVAFNKYVEFCEEYKQRYFEALRDLIAKGPHEAAVQHSADLAFIRAKWVLWVTSETDQLLKRQEEVMLSMGTDAHLSKPELAAIVPNRGELIQNMYRSFSLLLGLGEWNGEQLTKEHALESLMGGLKDTLGIEQFDRLRQATLDQALQDFDRTGKKSSQ